MSLVHHTTRLSFLFSAEKPFIDNPRKDNVYIDAVMPIEGSIRMESVSQDFGNGTTIDYGPVAIDGINGWTRIEAPGYGSGNSPTTSTLYE